MATATATGLNLKELCWGFFTMSDSLKIRTNCLNLFALGGALRNKHRPAIQKNLFPKRRCQMLLAPAFWLKALLL
jgi:hypothetical protein